MDIIQNMVAYNRLLHNNLESITKHNRITNSNFSVATHWTMIIGHDPIYYESTSYDEDSLSILRKQVDKLLTKYKIDFAVWSHERWYERSYPMVSNLTVSCLNNSGTNLKFLCTSASLG